MLASARASRGRPAAAVTCCSAACVASPSYSRTTVMSSRTALAPLPTDVRLQGGCSSSIRWSMQAPSRSTGVVRRRLVTLMGNKSTGGPFAPLVGLVRAGLGEKEFNKLRGKGISLHSQVIKDFCKQIGVDNKQVQGLIRLAKKNGEKLGFLA